MADTSTFTAIDLSRLPMPAVVEVLDYETVYARLLAKLQLLLPDFDASVEADHYHAAPGAKSPEEDARRMWEELKRVQAAERRSSFSDHD